jgi:hypothetical protein
MMLPTPPMRPSLKNEGYATLVAALPEAFHAA